MNSAVTKKAPPPPPPLKPKPKPASQVQYVVALYDFAAQVCPPVCLAGQLYDVFRIGRR